MTFEHSERLQLSLVSSQIVDVQLHTNSILSCAALNDCLSMMSPLRSDVLQILIDYPSVKSLRWESSSQSSTTLTLLSRNDSPSGVSVEVEFVPSSNHKKIQFTTLLNRLQDQRIILSPFGSISQKRLHRHIIQNDDDTTYRVNLPMEGSSVSSESVQANLPTCGLLSLADADTWSSYLLGSAHDMAHSPRRTWMDVSKNCSQELCKVLFKQGVQYGRRWRRSTLALSELLPVNRVSSCPWTTAMNVEVIRPKSVAVKFATESISTKDTDMLRKTTHSIPLSLSASFLRVAEGFSWGDITYGSIGKTIHRPQGVAHLGQLETTVTNYDIYEARVTLYDILPSYIRPTLIDMSEAAVRSYLPLETDSTLLKHEFVLPPQSSARLTVGYDPILLPFQHFPPDPNRGMEVPSSWVVWNASHTLYSPALLLLPPVPDMSMPFNIISLTCTLYVFVIGSIINTIVRRAEDKVYFQLYPDKRPKTIKQKLLEKLGRFKQKFAVRSKQKKAEIESKEQVEQETDEPVEDHWVPEAKMKDDNSDAPCLLSQAQRKRLAMEALPTTVADRSWKRMYSLERDEDSFETFLNNVAGEGETILVLKTTRGHLFGGYADHAWVRQKDYYGSGKACLFRMNGDETNVYRWSGANRLVQHVDVDKGRIIMGAGTAGGFGLCVEDNFRRGSTARSETYRNEPLCPDHLFEVEGFEVYGFIHGAF